MRALPSQASDADYQRLESEMEKQAPDVSGLAWGHKYFSLLFPDKLDSFHNVDLQRFHLMKILQIPPDTAGRYVLAGWYVEVARQLGLSVQQLAGTLHLRNGGKYRYWRIGTSEGDGRPTFWPPMRDQGYAAIGWPTLGDLSRYIDPGLQPLSDIKKLLEEQWPNAPQAIGRAAVEILNFTRNMQGGDIIIAANGETVLGVGRVDQQSRYRYEPTDKFPHRRAVTWLNVEPWVLPYKKEGLQSTFRELKNLENLVAIETRVALVAPKSLLQPPILATGLPGVHLVSRLEDTAGRIQSVLERKGQVILYGPPGTGKSYWAHRAAKDLAALREFGAPFHSLDSTKQTEVEQSGLVRTCTFHPSFGYEDFLEGYRPQSINGQLVFSLRDGIFKRLCQDARQKPTSSFFLILDEINRGDIPRIFGELLTILEKSKRGDRIHLAVSGELFEVPPNVYLIGTMNTADRSIALLDKALRRRFGFVECMPESSRLGAASLLGIPLGPWLDSVNRSIRERVGSDARNLQIGHSYLMEGDRPISEFNRLAQVLQDEIIPLLEEYCYEDYSSIAGILGNGLIDREGKTIRTELFADARREDLVQALLEPYPEIATSRQAIAMDEQAEADSPVGLNDDSDLEVTEKQG